VQLEPYQAPLVARLQALGAEDITRFWLNLCQRRGLRSGAARRFLHHARRRFGQRLWLSRAPRHRFDQYLRRSNLRAVPNFPRLPDRLVLRVLRPRTGAVWTPRAPATSHLHGTAPPTPPARSPAPTLVRSAEMEAFKRAMAVALRATIVRASNATMATPSPATAAVATAGSKGSA